MKEKTIIITYKELNSVKELPAALQELVAKASEAVTHAYAPYSNFRVGAAALLENGKIVTGSNQENASSPVGICAERVALSACSALYPDVAVIAMAITSRAKDHIHENPAMPCGLCRQTILEYEQRTKKEISLVLFSEPGKFIWFTSVKSLLPLYFGSEDLT